MWMYALNNISVRKLRTSLTVLGVAVCVQLFVVITSILNYTIKDLEQELAKYAGQMFVQVDTGVSTGEEFPPQTGSISLADSDAIIEAVAARIDPERSTPVVFQVIGKPAYPNGPPQAMAVGLLPGREAAYTRAPAASGSAALPASGGVVLGAAAAEYFNVDQVGATVTIGGEAFEVTGILEEQQDRVSNPVVLMALEDALRVMNQANPTALLLTVSNIGDVSALAEDIGSAFPDMRVITQAEIARNLDESLAGTRTFMSLINYTVLAAAIVLVSIVMYMAVMERTRELGILRAIGAGRSRVLGSLLLEAMVLSFVGGLIGNGAGQLLLIYAWKADFMVSGATAAAGVVAAAAIGGLGALIPAFKATQAVPNEALRYE